MLAKQKLIDLLHEDKYSRYEKILFILSVNIDIAKPVNEIYKIGSNAGLKEIYKWNASQYLNKKKSKGLAVHLKEGWILTAKGKRYVAEKLKIDLKTKRIVKVSISLRDLLKDITDTNTKDFLSEAISCFENKNYRAAVVLSWVGAMSVLQKYVASAHLTEFNREATRRDAKWKPAKNTDDLCRMKEKDFLEILVAISCLGKNVKQELEKCLILRNSCGHPNSLKIAENKVAAHIEDLILNVFKNF